jgi:hypothetical protein
MSDVALGLSNESIGALAYLSMFSIPLPSAKSLQDSPSSASTIELNISKLMNIVITKNEKVNQ